MINAVSKPICTFSSKLKSKAITQMVLKLTFICWTSYFYIGVGVGVADAW